MYVIGVDPDSKAHGVAIYRKGKLEILKTMPLMEFIFETSHLTGLGIVVHIEDTTANNASFKGRQPVNVQKDIGRRIGMVQQAQIELERACEWYKIPVVKHKISKAWKKDKKQFELATGWKGRSNEDTRSAAYFGFLGLTEGPV